MRGRPTVVAVLFVLALGAVAVRLYSLQVERHDHYTELAERQQQRVVELNPPRGTLYDARGRVLAVSTPADSLYAEPPRVKDPRSTARALAGVLGMKAREIETKLATGRWFVWIARQLDPETARRVRELDLPGIGLREEARRYYPMGELAASVLGFVGTDPKGLTGLELAYDGEVAGRAARRVLLRDAAGRAVFDPQLSWAEAEPGNDLYLTLDATLQHIAERELARAVEEFRARGGSAVLLDPATGAVKAMASYPPFDPNRFGDYPAERWRNRAVAEAFEPGSTFKMVTAAAALEHNLVDPADVIDCGNGQIQLLGVTIRDHRPFGRIPFREVIARSSNVGAIRTALLVGDRRFYDMIRALGFGERTGIDLPGESPGILHPLEAWQPLSKAYAAFGQGVSVTAVQLAAAFAAVANGGLLLRPYLVEAVGRDGSREPLHAEPQVVRRAISPATARQLERLLEAVVAEGGGGKAAVPGYTVAGKTGTAQQAGDGGYSSTHRVAGFVGFAPARRPALVAAVLIDRPTATVWGGQVAAPTFSAMMRPALLYLGVPPEREAPEAWLVETVVAAAGGGGREVVR